MRTVNSGLASGLLALALAVSAGCPSRHDAEPEMEASVEVVIYLPLAYRPRYDVLFVVDKSDAVAAQAKLVAAFPALHQALYRGGPANLHVGVVTSDLGTLNVATGDSACQGNGDGGVMQRCDQIDGAFIESLDIDGDGDIDQTNFGGSIDEAFACLADVGTEGCGFEQPLEAMRRALDPSPNVNPGFLREDARLLVVFLTNTDDCSVRDDTFFAPEDEALGPLTAFRCFEFGVTCDEDAVDERAPGPRTQCTSDEDSAYLYSVGGYADFLRSLKRDPNDVIVSVIGGNADVVNVDVRNDAGTSQPMLAPACGQAPASTVTATPAVRLYALTEQFPNRSGFTSVCRDDVSDAFFLFAGFEGPVGNPCFEDHVLDADPMTSGLQPNCVVSYVTGDPTTETPIDTRIEACNARPPVVPTNLPCWRAVPSSSQCPVNLYPDETALEVLPAIEPPPYTNIIARCEGEAL